MRTNDSTPQYIYRVDSLFRTSLVPLFIWAYVWPKDLRPSEFVDGGAVIIDPERYHIMLR